MAMQIKRRVGSGGAPPTLAEGQLGFNDPSTAGNDTQLIANDTALYVGSKNSNGTTDVIRALVSSARQLELGGAQTITGVKTIPTANLKLMGATAANQILTVSNIANGDLAWTTAPSGGLLTVATDGVTITGDGTSGDALEVLSIPERDITIQTRAQQPDGSITTINITPAAFDATADGIMTNFAITRLDDGTW